MLNLQSRWTYKVCTDWAKKSEENNLRACTKNSHIKKITFYKNIYKSYNS